MIIYILCAAGKQSTISIQERPRVPEDRQPAGRQDVERGDDVQASHQTKGVHAAGCNHTADEQERDVSSDGRTEPALASALYC